MDDGRAAHNALNSLKPLNAEVEGHRQRRCLPDEDFEAFLNAARSGKVIHRLTGLDRFMLYVVAGWTGLRAQELASLKADSFRLDASDPVLVVQAAYSKHKREDILPLRKDLTDLLRPWLTSKSTGHRLWPGAWWNKAAEMVQLDLAAAKSTWIENSSDPQEQKRRAESNRFAYCDNDGRYFDFHSLRGQFVSKMQSAGVSLKTLQTLARHSRVETTLKHYARVQIADIRGALDALPGLPNKEGTQLLRATGTEGTPRISASSLALSGRFRGTPIGAGGMGIKNSKNGVNASKQRDKTAFSAKEMKEAPPGFEPGMADLQSAARISQLLSRQTSYVNRRLPRQDTCLGDIRK